MFFILEKAGRTGLLPSLKRKEKFVMKVAVSAMRGEMAAQVDPRFGRCQYLMIIDTDTMDFEAIKNPNIMSSGGAGIQTSQLVAEKGVTAVITGHCGPNAFRTLEAAGIAVYTNATGSVSSSVEALKNGSLNRISSPEKLEIS